MTSWPAVLRLHSSNLQRPFGPFGILDTLPLWHLDLDTLERPFGNLEPMDLLVDSAHFRALAKPQNLTVVFWLIV